ncbi:hypothetical protein K438DRAFT_1924985 [Mycena galopus ATCC 62051]|nr:hypothetical protein K438DRAFT_1924985 [Mycena galopus ATCC 62051]
MCVDERVLTVVHLYAQELLKHGVACLMIYVRQRDQHAAVRRKPKRADVCNDSDSEKDDCTRSSKRRAISINDSEEDTAGTAAPKKPKQKRVKKSNNSVAASEPPASILPDENEVDAEGALKNVHVTVVPDNDGNEPLNKSTPVADVDHFWDNKTTQETTNKNGKRATKTLYDFQENQKAEDFVEYKKFCDEKNFLSMLPDDIAARKEAEANAAAKLAQTSLNGHLVAKSQLPQAGTYSDERFERSANKWSTEEYKEAVVHLKQIFKKRWDKLNATVATAPKPYRQPKMSKKAQRHFGVSDDELESDGEESQTSGNVQMLPQPSAIITPEWEQAFERYFNHVDTLGEDQSVLDWWASWPRASALSPGGQGPGRAQGSGSDFLEALALKALPKPGQGQGSPALENTMQHACPAGMCEYVADDEG